MQEARRFTVDVRRVVHETVEGEAILINLVSGNYYILGGCGAEVWSLLAEGRSGEEVVGELETRYEADRDNVAVPVHALIEEFVREELLEPANGNGAGWTNGSPIAANGGSFDPPVIRKFTDLQYFLLVDPIHQVAPAGWPYERRDSAPESADAA